MIFDSAAGKKRSDLLACLCSISKGADYAMTAVAYFSAIGNEVGEIFDFLGFKISTPIHLCQRYPVLGHLITNDLQYDNRSAFTLSLNHRETYTGITDRDRSQP